MKRDIFHLDEVLPHIEGRREFVLVDHGGYQSIDYCYVDDDSFDDPVRLECRGIKFDADGNVIARPLHKFFNVGERPDTLPETVDLSLPHVITEKLDGSMIHPAIVNGKLRLMTRRGITHTALVAETLLTQGYRNFCSDALAAELTPIFEFTGPSNRIVVRYDKPALTLLAVRNTFTGEYLPHEAIAVAAAEWGIPLVGRASGEWKTAVDFAQYVHDLNGVEGFVVRFDDGRMVKLKCLEYVTKHRAKDSIASEKNVLAVVLAGLLDDVLPLLDESDRDDVERYSAAVNEGSAATASRIESLVRDGAHLDQKAFAVDHLKGLDQHTRALAFQVRGGSPAVTAVRGLIAKHCKTRDRLESVRPLFGATYEHAITGEEP